MGTREQKSKTRTDNFGKHKKIKICFWGSRENADFSRGRREQVNPSPTLGWPHNIICIDYDINREIKEEWHINLIIKSLSLL